MNIKDLESKQFEKAAKAYLRVAFWCQSLTDDNDLMVETLDDVYAHEDLSGQALEAIDGYVFEILSKLSQMGFDGLRDDSVEAIMHGLGGSATGAGIGINDNGPIFPLQEEDMTELKDWHRKTWGVRTLDMYPGDDGKVHIEGCEAIREFTVEVSLSEGKGRNGALYRYTGYAPTWQSLAYKVLLEKAQDPNCRKQWVKLVRECK